MRDVISRGKLINQPNKENDGKWVTGYYVVFPRHTGRAIKYDLHCIFTNKGWRQIDSTTRGEYTGVTLPSSEMVFEGDVLYSACDLDGDGVLTGELLEVYWDNDLHGFLLRNPQYNTPCDMDTDFSDMKLVGNIHDNPDIWRTYEA